MLTDQISQIHRSPGFITSNLIGKRDDGTIIKEFEASHGTVTDLWRAHLAGEETSMNPLGLVEALIGAIAHSVAVHGGRKDSDDLISFTVDLRCAMHETFAVGEGTRDMMGPKGKTTEQFVEAVAARLEKFRIKAFERRLTTGADVQLADPIHKKIDDQVRACVPVRVPAACVRDE
jgi:isocitrate dehydrogenase